MASLGKDLLIQLPLLLYTLYKSVAVEARTLCFTAGQLVFFLLDSSEPFP